MSVPCPNCGRLNRPGARYCASCRSPLGPAGARLQAGQFLDGGAYRVVRPLGKGGMGAVWLVAQTKAFDRLAVLKEVIDYFDPTDVREREKAAQRFEAEARTLGDLKHPGIPDLYAYFSENAHNYLVMEYIEGQDLRRGLTREDSDSGQIIDGAALPVDEILRYVIQICLVLEYLANRKPPVVHNDIKPGNIIIDKHSGRAVLVDFGTAKTRYLRATGRPDGKRASVYGTVGYAAPELYRGHSEPRSDVYSLAATAYHLLTDDDPRDHPNQYPQLDTLPPRLEETMRSALAHEVRDRPDAVQFRQQLEAYLTGESAPLRTLAFPGGDAADSLEAVLTLAVKHWRYTAGILNDGTLALWLRRTLRDTAAAQAAEDAARQWPGDPDAALDALLRRLDPSALPQGRMELGTTSVRLRATAAEQSVPGRIEYRNRGPGHLRGEILTSQPWVRVSGALSCPPGQSCVVPIEIDTRGLEPGRPHVAAVTLIPVDGTPEVVAVQVTISGGEPEPAQPQSPAIRVHPNRIDLGTVTRQDLSTARKSVIVTNIGETPAEVKVQDAPRWLLVKPGSFRLPPGAEEVVELVGRVSKARGRKQRVMVTFAVKDGQERTVEVVLTIKRSGLLGA